MSSGTIRAFSLPKFPIVQPSDDLGALILKTLANENVKLIDNDIIVIASKVVSISENRIVNGNSVNPSKEAIEIAFNNDFDPIHVEIALQDCVDVLRKDQVLITETKSGLICNFSGVDKSNVPEGSYILLPENPDSSANRILNQLKTSTGKQLAVIITDTQGRPWRRGSINIAIGSAGIAPFKYNRGRKDLYGRVLQRSTVCQVDEIAMFVEPIMGQAGETTPVVIVRGYEFSSSDEGAQSIIRPESEDMFR